MNTSINIDDYFRRIGYTGKKTPGIETLHEIQYHHALSIPFENLNPFLGLPVRLDIESIVQKLVHDNRGGYCFEQNLLLKHVLDELGFQVAGLAARVRWNAPDDVITARGHMLLLVEINNEQYIVDVGFGLLTPLAPLRLVTGIEQSTQLERYRLIGESDDFILQAQIRNEWKALYRFDLQEQFLPDYKVTNWYLSNHPESHFVTGLIVDQPEPDRRNTLHNNTFSVRYPDGRDEKTVLGSVDEIRDILQNVYLLKLPDTPVLDEKLEKLLFEEKKAN